MGRGDGLGRVEPEVSETDRMAATRRWEAAEEPLKERAEGQRSFWELARHKVA